MGSNAHLSVDRDSRRDKNRRVNLHLAMIHAELGLAAGNAEAAIKFAKEALQADALHVGALELLAKAQWQAGQCDELLSTLRTLIELNPYEPGYHSLQAGAYQSMGLCGSAVESYMRAVDLGMPKSVEMDAMIEDLRRWQGGLVTSLLSTDPVFKASYEQDPARACRERGFNFAIPPETTEHIIRERESRAAVFVRPS